MSRSIFGWSYPPGCSGPPEYPDPSPLEDAVLALLEEAGINTETNDQIMTLIQVAEATKAQAGRIEPEYD